MYIARNIKSSEKALHGFSPQPFVYTKSSAPLSLSAPSKPSSSPTDLAKRLHLKARSGRTTTSKSPFCNAIRAFSQGLVVRWVAVGGLGMKKGKHLRAPLANAKIIPLKGKCKRAAKTIDTPTARPVCQNKLSERSTGGALDSSSSSTREKRSMSCCVSCASGLRKYTPRASAFSIMESGLRALRCRNCAT